MKENHKAMNSYVKAISSRNEGEDKDKVLPVGSMGAAMAKHGEDFENDSEFGQCLVGEFLRASKSPKATNIVSHGSNKRENCPRSRDLYYEVNFNLA